MALPRFVGVLDIGVAVVVAVAIFLPSREMFADSAFKGDGSQQFAIALAEARTIARPDDGVAVEDFARRLGRSDMKDWAIEASVKASERAKDSPTRWRSLIAASTAYVETLDVIPALDYANRALAACESAREKGDAMACPSWEEVRMRLYHSHLDAGVKSGIDPKVDAAGFRRAGESALRQIYIGDPHNRVLGGSGDGSAAGSAGTAPPQSAP
jgi:hypothetical protein